MNLSEAPKARSEEGAKDPAAYANLHSSRLSTPGPTLNIIISTTDTRGTEGAPALSPSCGRRSTPTSNGTLGGQEGSRSSEKEVGLGALKEASPFIVSSLNTCLEREHWSPFRPASNFLSSAASNENTNSQPGYVGTSNSLIGLQGIQSPPISSTQPISESVRSLWPANVGEDDTLSITIPLLFPSTSEGPPPPASLHHPLLITSAPTLTPGHMGPSGTPPAGGKYLPYSPRLEPFAPNAPSTPGGEDAGPHSDNPNNAVLPPNEDLSEEEKIDVCSVKETLLLKEVERDAHSNLTDNACKTPNGDPSEGIKKDFGSPFFSQLGNQCSRTLPSLMKFYSRHKRSLSTSLSVNLAMSGQATPPCSPISPGTLCLVPPVTPQRSSLEASTMTSPTERTLTLPPSGVNARSGVLAPPDASPAAVVTSAPMAALTLLSVPNLASPGTTVSGSKLTSPSAIKSKKQGKPDDKDASKIALESSSPTVTSVGSIPPPGLTFPPPWSLPHSTLAHPGSYWLHHSQYSGVEASAGLGLGYHVARDPLTGHLFLLSRPHPMPDPGSHGLVWAGYGSVPTPPVVMTPQQLLLDPRYRPALHAPPPLMHVHHAHPSLHPEQQQQSIKKEDASPAPPKEESKKSAAIPLVQVPSNQPAEMAIPPIPPPNISPHFLYPPTSLPYYYPQPAHHTPFNLSAFSHPSNTALGMPPRLPTNLLTTPLTTHTFTTSTTTVTTTVASAPLTSPLSVSNTKGTPLPPSSVWSRGSNPIPSPGLHHRDLHFGSSGLDQSLYSEPPMDLTRRSPKSPSCEVVSTTVPRRSLSPSRSKAASQGKESRCPAAPVRIKKEIKEEAFSPCFSFPDESRQQPPAGLNSRSLPHQIKSEWNQNLLMLSEGGARRRADVERDPTPSALGVGEEERPDSLNDQETASETQFSYASNGSEDSDSNEETLHSTLHLSSSSPHPPLPFRLSPAPISSPPPSLLSFPSYIPASAPSSPHLISFSPVLPLSSPPPPPLLPPPSQPPATVSNNAIDSSGLELLLQTFLQHGDRLAPSPAPRPESDSESTSSQSEQMPHLERAVKTPSPRCSPASFESQPPVLTPFAFTNEAEDSPPPSTHEQTASLSPPPPPLDAYVGPAAPPQSACKPSGFSVLCALAEQRIMEEQEDNCSALSSLAEVASSTPSVPTIPFCVRENPEASDDVGGLDSSAAVASTSFFASHDDALGFADEATDAGNHRNADINRNYKSPESEREARAFIATKASLCQKEATPDLDPVPPYPLVDMMDPAEIDMRMKLAELQRQYKEKQRELSRLQPKRELSCSSPFKRGRGRPPKSKLVPSSFGMKKKVGRPLKKVKPQSSPLTLEPKSNDTKPLTEPEGNLNQDGELPIMQSPLRSPILSMQHSSEGNSNSLPRWQPKLEEESSDEEIPTPAAAPDLTLLDAQTRPSAFKLPPKHETKQEDSDEDRHETLLPSADYIGKLLHQQVEALVESSTSDAEFHCTSSSSKKRKPGRPKKHSPTKYDATETIVAKKPKTLEFLLLSHKSKIRPKLKAELKIRSSDQEDDSGANHVHGPHQGDFSEEEVDEHSTKTQKAVCKTKKLPEGIRRRGAPIGRSSLSRNTVLRDKEKRKSVFEKNSRMQELFRSLKRYSTIAAPEHDESEDEKEYKAEDVVAEALKEDREPAEDCKANLRHLPSTEASQASNPPPTTEPQVSPPSEQKVKDEPGTTSDVMGSSDASPLTEPVAMETAAAPGPEEGPDHPREEPPEPPGEASAVVGEKEKTEPRSESSSVCSLQVDDLVLGARVMVLQDGLLYAGNLSPITPPDVYGIHIDGERGTRPHICCQEELLTQAWKEVKPGSTRFLTEGTRVCAFWSQQYRGLYPGCVAAASSPTHEGNHNLVNVEFDDGDSGRIHVDDIRLLPQDFPVIEYDPNPLLTLNKRKRRPTEEDHGDANPPEQKSPKKPRRKHHGRPRDDPGEGNAASVDVSKVKKENNKEGKKGQRKKKRIPKKSFTYMEERKRHKKRRRRHLEPSLHKHRHKRKHKHRRRNSSSHLFPHVEQGDSELRMRIKSPPPLKGDQASPTESSSEESHDSEITEHTTQPMRRQKRSPSEKSKIAPFLLERQLWGWSGKGYKRPGAKGKGKKEFYKEIVRGKEHIRVGDCAVFLSSGSHDRPFIGKIDFLWEAWGGNMVVKVRWFYHPDETIGTERKLAEPRGALFSSSHTDENDVQTISHKCHVVPLAEYRIRRAEVDRKRGPNYENYDLYYLAGFYDPTYTRITMEPGVS